MKAAQDFINEYGYADGDQFSSKHVAEYAVQVADSLIKHLNFETP